MTDQARSDRQARRQWLLDHHPDRGGDPDDFRVGLAGAAWSAPERVLVVRGRRDRARRWWRHTVRGVPVRKLS